MSLSNAAKLAMKFSELLRDDLTEEQMDLVLERNAAEPQGDSPRVCHSHDFCDANEIMEDALQCLGAEPEFRPELCELINAAWKLARDSEFDDEKIADDEAYFEMMTGEDEQLVFPPAAWVVIQQRGRGQIVQVFGPYPHALAATTARDQMQQTDPELLYTALQTTTRVS